MEIKWKFLMFWLTSKNKDNRMLLSRSLASGVIMKEQAINFIINTHSKDNLPQINWIMRLKFINLLKLKIKPNLKVQSILHALAEV
jgi:hypothetical protein